MVDMTTFPILPAVGPATLLRALFKSARRGEPPAEIMTTYRLDRIDADSVARYNALLGFAPDALPVSFYYLPTQRAHMATLLGPQYPYRIAGMIHVENDIQELRRPEPGLPMELSTRVTMEPVAANGARYCVLHTVGVQQGQPIFECRSRYLALRGKQRAEQRERSAAEPGGQLVGEWSLASHAGRRYAAVSGDWNPIHLWPWSARLLGMKTPIIHGMHTVGKACALLEQANGQRLTAISARFKAPIALGARVELRAAQAGSYDVWADGKQAVTGDWC